MRHLPAGIVAVISILAAAGGFLIYNNNRQLPMPSREQLDHTRESAIDWLVNNGTRALDAPNPVLWHMVQKAAALSGDHRLESLFAEYARRYVNNRPNNVWRPLFYSNSWVPVRYESIKELPYYNQLFIYAITCDTELAEAPGIAAQTSPSLCNLRLRSPSCRTHQMMGLLMMKRSQCGDRKQLEKSIATLQRRIRTQLIWDTRVVDVYMQRVLMLVESGGTELVKPVWVHRLVKAQQADGGWADFIPLIPLGNGRYLGTRKFLSPETGSPESGFHMTAQGILLFTLLTYQPPPTAAAAPR